MGSIWSKEPAIIIGAVLTVVLNLVASLAGQGFISDAIAGHLTDIFNSLGALVVALLPVITAIFVRQAVYSPASYDAKG